MVEIINKSVCRGVAGRRAGNVKGAVIHNDAGSVNATAKHYIKALGAMNTNQLANGFAHYYIDRHTIARTEDTYNQAWHTANTDGNANYIGYEVCQSIGASDADFLANEQVTLKQVAEDLKYYGLPANRNTVKLHNQFVATACPHRSQALHGNGVACQDYFITQINKFMNGGVVTNPLPGGGTTVHNALPVRKDATRSTACVDEFSLKNGKLYARGWHIGNYSYQYLFIMDASTGIELARVNAKGVSRPDVNKVYNTKGNVGFSEQLEGARFKGKKVWLKCRCTNDPKGNNAGGYSDVDYNQWSISV